LGQVPAVRPQRDPRLGDGPHPAQGCPGRVLLAEPLVSPRVPLAGRGPAAGRLHRPRPRDVRRRAGPGDRRREPDRPRRLRRLPRHDAANLFALPVLRDLDHLDLSDNALHADGVAALAESNITRGLRTLNLSQTLPGVPGIQALTEEKSRLARLRSLDLSAN